MQTGPSAAADSAPPARRPSLRESVPPVQLESSAMPLRSLPASGPSSAAGQPASQAGASTRTSERPRRDSLAPGARESLPRASTPPMRRPPLLAAPPVRAAEPSTGAARREGLLLAAYVVVFVVGVWTVVVSELSPPEPATLRPQTVTPPTQSSLPAGK